MMIDAKLVAAWDAFNLKTIELEMSLCVRLSALKRRSDPQPRCPRRHGVQVFPPSARSLI